MATSKLIQMQPNLAFPERLSEKHRPLTVDDFIGLEIPKRIMGAFVRNPKPDAFYFVGPPGCGKTAMALAVIDQINAEHHHIPSRNCDLETIEDTVRNCWRAPWIMFGPNAGKPSHLHCIHVSEADQMTGGAQLALLSKMDATAWPPATFFIFTANGKVLLEPRFLSRCKVIDFANPLDGDLAKYLAKVYRKEGGSYPVDYAEITAQTGGNVRDALGKLEMEVMIGNDRKGLPELAKHQAADHTHKCGECGITIDCDEKDCRKAAVSRQCPLSGMPPCAGTTPEKAERGRRAWQTRREKNR